MELELKTIFDHSPAPNSRRRIERAPTGSRVASPSVQSWCLSQRMVPTTPVVLERTRPACAAGLEPTQGESGHGVVGGHEYE